MEHLDLDHTYSVTCCRCGDPYTVSARQWQIHRRYPERGWYCRRTGPCYPGGRKPREEGLSIPPQTCLQCGYVWRLSRNTLSRVINIGQRQVRCPHCALRMPLQGAPDPHPPAGVSAAERPAPEPPASGLLWHTYTEPTSPLAEYGVVQRPPWLLTQRYGRG